MARDSKKLQKDIFSAEFKKFCRKNIQAPMKELEKKRHNYILGIYGTVLIAIIIEIAIGFYLYINEIMNDDIAALLFSVMAIAGGACVCISKAYKTEAKQIILPQLLSYVGEFEIINPYDVESHLTSYLHNLELIPNFNRSSFDDCLHGKYNGVELGISETCLQYVSGSGKRRRRTTVFKGLFICFKSFKNFEHRTIIKKEATLSFKGNNTVNLEDPEFESLYHVTSEDQIEARYLITPAFMNRMVELNKKGIGKMITISFEEDNVNIAISSSKDWFEIPLFKPATDIANYRAIVLELISIFSIIDTLKLDQNVGM